MLVTSQKTFQGFAENLPLHLTICTMMGANGPYWKKLDPRDRVSIISSFAIQEGMDGGALTQLKLLLGATETPTFHIPSQDTNEFLDHVLRYKEVTNSPAPALGSS
jgi:hypothetical protein